MQNLGRPAILLRVVPQRPLLTRDLNGLFGDLSPPGGLVCHKLRKAVRCSHKSLTGWRRPGQLYNEQIGIIRTRAGLGTEEL